MAVLLTCRSPPCEQDAVGSAFPVDHKVNCRSARCFRSTNCHTVMPVPGVPVTSSKLQAAPVRQSGLLSTEHGTCLERHGHTPPGSMERMRPTLRIASMNHCRHMRQHVGSPGCKNMHLSANLPGQYRSAKHKRINKHIHIPGRRRTVRSGGVRPRARSVSVS